MAGADPAEDIGARVAELRPMRDALRGVLFESRQRWRDLVTLAADFVYETDAAGRLVFVSPDPAFGWPTATLLGQPGELLLFDRSETRPFNPFRLESVVRRRRAWLRRPDGGAVCFSFAATPLLDAQGRFAGARGIAQDVTDQDGHDSTVAAALRRSEVIDHILWCMRQEILAPRMMQAALDALMQAIAAEGCAVVDVLGDGVKPDILHRAGAPRPSILPAVSAALEHGIEGPATIPTADGTSVIVCPSQTRFGEHAGLALWRAPGALAWNPDDLSLADAASRIIRVILEHESIQREMVRQARTDPLTGLLNRRAFLDELGRRFDRLEREGLPGTLLFVDLDYFKDLNDLRGHDVGDDALCIAAALLRAVVRPSDLVARLGGDEFALWLDGADDLTAAERAETLRTECPDALAHLTEGLERRLTMSIGIATRWPGRGEDVDTLMGRADRVMYEVKRAGRGNWRVAHEGSS